MQSLEAFLARASDLVWGPPLLILLFGTHLFLTVRLKFIQRYLPQAIKLSFSREKEGDGDVSQFGALTTALAATIGTGNIVGVATAVAAGGPGAVLWMWLTGVFGVATKYAEAVLAVKYRVKQPNGMMAGGPMYALERGLGSKPLGMLFAALTAVAAFGIGCMTQANSISGLAQQTFGVSPWITGTVMTVLTAIVILGGITSIASVCEKLVPFMAAFYVLGCLILIAMHLDRVPATLSLIVSSAFTGQAAVGGFLGAGVMQAMRFGIARGLFSNESGLGSAPIVAAAAQTRNPVRQALVSSTGTFWDTVVVCAMTGLVVVNSGGWTQGMSAVRADQVRLRGSAHRRADRPDRRVVDLRLLDNPRLGLLRRKGRGIPVRDRRDHAVPAPRVVAVMVGSVSTLQAVWSFSDVANGLMAVPNLISLLALNGVIVKETHDYLWSGNLDKRA